MKQISGILVMLVVISVVCFAAEKQYQTGKLVDVESEGYSRLVGNASTGSSTSIRYHENRISVQAGDTIYVGECTQKPHWSSCKPGDWVIGDPIEFRIEKGHLWLKKPNGKELKTKIVKRVRVEASNRQH